MFVQVSIVPRTSNILGFAQYTPQETKIYSSDQLFDQMCMKLGGLAAENVIFRKTSSGIVLPFLLLTLKPYFTIKYC